MKLYEILEKDAIIDVGIMPVSISNKSNVFNTLVFIADQIGSYLIGDNKYDLDIFNKSYLNIDANEETDDVINAYINTALNEMYLYIVEKYKERLDKITSLDVNKIKRTKEVFNELKTDMVTYIEDNLLEESKKIYIDKMILLIELFVDKISKFIYNEQYPEQQPTEQIVNQQDNITTPQQFVQFNNFPPEEEQVPQPFIVPNEEPIVIDLNPNVSPIDIYADEQIKSHFMVQEGVPITLTDPDDINAFGAKLKKMSMAIDEFDKRIGYDIPSKFVFTFFGALDNWVAELYDTVNDRICPEKNDDGSINLEYQCLVQIPGFSVNWTKPEYTK